jgi:GNAT superfamily N-acetyltransferase
MLFLKKKNYIQTTTRATSKMTDIIYEDYPFIGGERKDENLNKRIISLSKRHKFYFKQIQSILNGGGWFRPKSYQICVAKKLNKKGGDYKVVGFIIYFGKTIFGNGERMCMTLEYWLVDKKFQGQGIGKRLYEEMEKTATEWGIVNYNVMYDKNDEKLTNLYNSLGYKVIPRYDGQQVVNDDKHIKIYKVVISLYHIPSSFSGEGEQVPPLNLLR